MTPFHVPHKSVYSPHDWPNWADWTRRPFCSLEEQLVPRLSSYWIWKLHLPQGLVGWICALRRFLFSFVWLCIKVGRGHRDACVGTWVSGTRDEGLKDIKYGARGRVGRGRGNVKYRDAGDAGCEWFLQKSVVNASLSLWICFGEDKPPCPP